MAAALESLLSNPQDSVMSQGVMRRGMRYEKEPSFPNANLLKSCISKRSMNFIHRLKPIALMAPPTYLG